MRTLLVFLFGLLAFPLSGGAQQADNYPPDSTTVALPAVSLPVVSITTDYNAVIQRSSDIPASVSFKNMKGWEDKTLNAAVRYWGWEAFSNSDKKSFSLSVPSSGSYRLQASFSDRSHLRTPLLSVLARRVGLEVPEAQLCEVVVNNIYYGVYTFVKEDSTAMKKGNAISAFLVTELAHFLDGFRNEDLGDAALAFGNCDAYDVYRTDTWVSASNTILKEQDAPSLVPDKWSSFFSDASLLEQSKERWDSLHTTSLSENNIDAVIDSLSALLTTTGAQERNCEAWPRWGEKIWPNYFVPSSYDAELSNLKTWIHDRLSWMDENIGKTDNTTQTKTVTTTPLIVSKGFNTDCIAESSSAAPRDKSSHPALDGHGSVFTTSAVSANAKAVPDDGALTDTEGFTYQLGDYAANNCLYLPQENTSGILTFSNPCPADSLAILLVGTNKGDSYDLRYNVVVNYTDGTQSDAETYTAHDWSNGGTFQFYRWRADNGSGKLETNQTYGMQRQIVACDGSKEVSSLIFTSKCPSDSWGYGMISIFAVSALRSVSTSIYQVKRQTSSERVGVWSVDGKKMNRLSRGVNIVRYKDGRTIKVYNK